jgi:hypothetical protein
MLHEGLGSSRTFGSIQAFGRGTSNRFWISSVALCSCSKETQDEHGTAGQIEAIRARIPSASTIILEHCKHAPHRDECEAILSAISQFLRTTLREPQD